jgi:hypothetical protein
VKSPKNKSKVKTQKSKGKSEEPKEQVKSQNAKGKSQNRRPRIGPFFALTFAF